MACLGSLFEQLGRFLVGSFRDVVSNLLKNMKNAEVSLLLPFPVSVMFCCLFVVLLFVVVEMT